MTRIMHLASGQQNNVDMKTNKIIASLFLWMDFRTATLKQGKTDSFDVK